jgi:hypothetical protein
LGWTWPENTGWDNIILVKPVPPENQQIPNTM